MPGRGLPPGPAQVGLYGQIPCELASFPALDFSDLSGALFHPHGCPHNFSSSRLPHRDKNNLFRKPWGECRNETLTACARPGLPPPSAILVSLALLVGCGLSAVTEKGVWSGGRDLQGPGVTSSCRATSFSRSSVRSCQPHLSPQILQPLHRALAPPRLRPKDSRSLLSGSLKSPGGETPRR